MRFVGLWVKVSLKISYEDTIFLGNYEAERGKSTRFFGEGALDFEKMIML